MKRSLHLYNLLGAASERTWLDFAVALGSHGYEPTLACERVVGPVPKVSGVPVMLERLHVQASADPRVIDREMQSLSARPPAVQGDFDVVHAHFGPRLLHALPYLRLGVRGGGPVVISLYGYDLSRLLREPGWAERYRWAAERGGEVLRVVRVDAGPAGASVWRAGAIGAGRAAGGVSERVGV